MWRVASEAYAYLAGHPFLTDTVLHNQKTAHPRISYRFGDTEAKMDWGYFYPPVAGIRVNAPRGPRYGVGACRNA